MRNLAFIAICCLSLLFFVAQAPVPTNVGIVGGIGQTVVQVPCNATLSTYINASSPANTIYQLAGTPATPCTYSGGMQVHTANNITITGYIDPVNNPVGTSTIIDGGQGAAGGSGGPFTCGSSASSPATCLGGTPDYTTGVTFQYLTIKNYAGSKTCIGGVGTNCGSTCGAAAFDSQSITATITGTALNATVNASALYLGVMISGGGATAGTFINGGSGPNSWTVTPSQTSSPTTMTPPVENWCAMLSTWNNWTLNHLTLQGSGGYGAMLTGGNVLAENSLLTANSHGGFGFQTTFANGNNGGPITIQNNEGTGNNARGDDPTNDANGCVKGVSRGDLGGPIQAVNVINNYCHDNNAVGIWFDIDASHAELIQGNTVLRSLAPPLGFLATLGVDCIRVEINSGYSEIGHNVMAECQNGGTLTLVNSSNSKVHNNFSYTDNVNYTGALGINATITCRADNPAGITPGVAIQVDNNIEVFARNQNNNGAGGMSGYFDFTGTSSTPGGAGCANPFPSVAQYATVLWGDNIGNLFYSPGGSADSHWGYAAQGNPGNLLSYVQGDKNPTHPPSNGTVTGWATGDCSIHIASVSAGFSLYLGTSLWSVGTENTPMTIQSINSGSGGIGQYWINWCPTFASSGSPATLQAVFAANEELGSSVRSGAVIGTSTVNTSGVLTIGTVTSGLVAVGQSVMGVDGSGHTLPYGTYVSSLTSGGGGSITASIATNQLTVTVGTANVHVGSLITGAGVPANTYVASGASSPWTLSATVGTVGSESMTATDSNGSTWQLSVASLANAIASSTIYLNAPKAVVLGCQTTAALGGCPNGSGI